MPESLPTVSRYFDLFKTLRSTVALVALFLLPRNTESRLSALDAHTIKSSAQLSDQNKQLQSLTDCRNVVKHCISAGSKKEIATSMKHEIG